jgi:dihydrofolate reductase
VLASKPLAQPRGDGSDQAARNSRERAHAESETIVVRSLADALVTAERLPGEIYICGGERIYAETLALMRPMRLHLTLIHADISGDTFFPEWRHLAWQELTRRESSDANYRYTFFTLEREL